MIQSTTMFGLSLMQNLFILILTFYMLGKQILQQCVIINKLMWMQNFKF